MTQPASPHLILLGAAAGDMIGAPYEFIHWKSYDFPLFKAESLPTDDTFLTLAVAQAILDGGDYGDYLGRFGRKYPSSYGLKFGSWLYAEFPTPYDSWGNGSAMRVSPIGWAFDSLEEVLRQAEASSAVTHNHPEGIQGAQATALVIFLARHGASRAEIRQEIETHCGYDLSQTFEQIRPGYRYSEACRDTVPASILAFLESTDFEDAIRKAISLGGDADTLAAITGSMAEAFYGGVPEPIAVEVRQRLPSELWQIIERFNQRFPAN